MGIPVEILSKNSNFFVVKYRYKVYREEKARMIELFLGSATSLEKNGIDRQNR